jgi:hypothetical protein
VTAVLRQLVREHPWLLPVADMARLALFVGFVTLVLLVGWRARAGWSSPRTRGAVNTLIVYVLAASCATGFFQQEAWPFTHWALVRNVAAKRSASWELQGLDGSGRSWVIDPAVLQPLSPDELGVWMSKSLSALDPASRAAIGRFVLERAEHARQRLVTGRRFAANEWLLGPLAAPYHGHARGAWRTAADVPPTAFVAVRVWALEWNVEERFQDEQRVTRTLRLEYRDRDAG